MTRTARARARYERTCDWTDRHPYLSRAIVLAAGWCYLWAAVGLVGPR